MNRLESSTPSENAPFIQRHLPDIGGLPEGHATRLLWKAKLEQGKTVDAGRIDEYHNALKRHRQWLKKPLPEAVEGARLGLHTVIEHEVSEPQGAARQIELIDQVANGYEMSIV